MNLCACVEFTPWHLVIKCATLGRTPQQKVDGYLQAGTDSFASNVISHSKQCVACKGKTRHSANVKITSCTTLAERRWLLKVSSSGNSSTSRPAVRRSEGPFMVHSTPTPSRQWRGAPVYFINQRLSLLLHVQRPFIIAVCLIRRCYCRLAFLFVLVTAEQLQRTRRGGWGWGESVRVWPGGRVSRTANWTTAHTHISTCVVMTDYCPGKLNTQNWD